MASAQRYSERAGEDILLMPIRRRRTPPDILFSIDPAFTSCCLFDVVACRFVDIISSLAMPPPFIFCIVMFFAPPPPPPHRYSDFITEVRLSFLAADFA